jgi:replicative DNA helicase
LTDEEIQSFNYTIPALIKSKIFIQDFIKRELEDTVAAIRLMVMQKHIEYVVVENAGNINVKYFREDERRTAEISKTMKALAKELDICIILVSHLSRERDGKKVQPTLNRLRHSGQLEADADIVIFVYRAELHGYETFQDESDEEGIQTAGIIKVIIAKGRNIGVSQAYMRFDEQLIHFSENNDSDAELAF